MLEEVVVTDLLTSRVNFDYLANRPDCVELVARWTSLQWFGTVGQPRREVLDAIGERCRRDQLPIGVLASCGEELIGMASLVEDVLPSGRVWVPCLADVYVAPAWRGRGVGTSLCLRMLEEARNFGLQELSLYTTDREEFYERLGWVKQCEALVETEEGYRLAAFMERSVEEESLRARTARTESKARTSRMGCLSLHRRQREDQSPG